MGIAWLNPCACTAATAQLRPDLPPQLEAPQHQPPPAHRPVDRPRASCSMFSFSQVRWGAPGEQRSNPARPWPLLRSRSQQSTLSRSSCAGTGLLPLEPAADLRTLPPRPILQASSMRVALVLALASTIALPAAGKGEGETDRLPPEQKRMAIASEFIHISLLAFLREPAFLPAFLRLRHVSPHRAAGSLRPRPHTHCRPRTAVLRQRQEGRPRDRDRL